MVNWYYTYDKVLQHINTKTEKQLAELLVLNRQFALNTALLCIILWLVNKFVLLLLSLLRTKLVQINTHMRRRQIFFFKPLTNNNYLQQTVFASY